MNNTHISEWNRHTHTQKHKGYKCNWNWVQLQYQLKTAKQMLPVKWTQFIYAAFSVCLRPRNGPQQALTGQHHLDESALNTDMCVCVWDHSDTKQPPSWMAVLSQPHWPPTFYHPHAPLPLLRACWLETVQIGVSQGCRVLWLVGKVCGGGWVGGCRSDP